MYYISLEDLNNDIRNNFYKIRLYEGKKPFCGVLGVPRSGMIPASIIAEMLNVGLASVNEFVENQLGSFDNHGGRLLNSVKPSKRKKLLVVEDTCYNGYSLERTKKLLEPLSYKYEFVFMCVYLEGTLKVMTPDFFLRDIREIALKTETKTALYEWNIMHNIQGACIYDVDGVIFLNPPKGLSHREYVNYIKNPVPLYIPSTSRKLTFCTYRLIKYYDITFSSLLKNGIKPKKLYMFESDSYAERKKTPSYIYKSHVYSELEPEKRLFIESNDTQAKLIYETTKKPVYCLTSNKMYS